MTREKLLELASDVEEFPLHQCGPSDDPDQQTAYLYGYRDVAKRFVAAVRRYNHPALNEQLQNINTAPEFITDAYDLQADIQCVIDALRDLPDDQLARQQLPFAPLLHPLIARAALRHYEAGDYRNAVLDAVIVIFDEMRARTGLDLDGEALVGQVLSLHAPRLILSELDTQSGRNDQSGFADILRGLYRGVRNPKAHSRVHDLDALKGGQYLVMTSLLMRRVTDAVVVVQPDQTSANDAV
jgi:uncharacterized protein (TIGR02391 family)